MSDNTQKHSMIQVQQSIWLAAKRYLEDNPTARYAVDALVLAEVAKSAKALLHLSVDGSIDYSLYENDIPITEKHLRTIVSWADEEWPRTVEIPDRVSKLYIYPSLDTKEFTDLASSKAPALTMDTASLEAVRDRIGVSIATTCKDAIDNILKQAKLKYKDPIKDRQIMGENENISREELWNQANFYYKAYTEKRFEEAREGFYRLASYIPTEVYNHAILFEINVELRDYARAFEEILYADYVSDKNDIKLLYNMAHAIRKLGLTPALVVTSLDPILDKFREDAAAGDNETRQFYNELVYLNKLGTIVTLALATMQMVTLAAQSPNALENMHTIVEEQNEQWKQEEIKEREEQDAEVEQLVGTSVFISYRRHDSTAEVDQLCNILSTRFPRLEVFRDVSSISPGEAFEQRLERQIKEADVILAIIGPAWAGRVESGEHRLDDRRDYVRRELTAALQRNDVVILPVLVKNAAMPKSEDLPTDLKAISQLQALDVKPASFTEDMEQLISELIMNLKARVLERQATFRELSEAMESTTRGKLKLDTDFNKIYYSDPFDESGRWECMIKSSRGNGKLLVTIKGNGTFQGTWEPNAGKQLSINGNVSKVTDAKQISLSLYFDGMIENLEPFALVVPINRRMGKGYQGTDESGGSYFLRLIERTWEGL